MRWCALSVDLDEIPHYHRIHGLPAPSGAAAHAVYDIALDRCFEFARAEAIPLTFFVVAADTERPESAERLRCAVHLGHEIGNHSKDHFYDLVRRPRAEQIEQVLGARELIYGNVGVRAAGFRAPGYTVTNELLEVVAEAGHGYDSSVFPSPAYYAAKAAAFGALALRGRRSDAILSDPSVLAAPTQPYRLGKRYQDSGSGLPELPIQVTRGPRLPYIGTALTLAGVLGSRVLTELVIGAPFINLELHGIDWLSADDGLGALRGYQPDIRIPSARKSAVFRAVVHRLRGAGYRFVRLSDGAAVL